MERNWTGDKIWACADLVWPGLALIGPEPAWSEKKKWLSFGESLERLLLLWDLLTHYMKQKPKFSGMTNEKYENFIRLFEDKFFKLQITYLSKIMEKINQANITFQNQSLEIHLLKLTMTKLIKDIANLLFPFEEIPKDLRIFKTKEWKEIELHSSKFLSTESFTSTLITDLGFQLRDLNHLKNQDQNQFADIFQPFLAKLLSKLNKYLPYEDKIIDTLDFVTLNMEFPDLKRKILDFNSYFQIVEQEQIADLVQEISSLSEMNLVLLRKKAKKSSLRLWDLIIETEENENNEERTFRYLSKIFKIAHSLSTFFCRS